MEKFERFKLETLETPESRRRRMERGLNAHSDVIEALAEAIAAAAEVATAHTDEIEALRADVARLTPIWKQLRKPAFTFADVKCEAPAGMTAQEAVAIVVLAFMPEMTGDIHTDAWLERIRGRIVQALREHGREGE